MATVEIVPVLIWYAVTPQGVQARIRTYAAGMAIQEKNIGTDASPLAEAQLFASAAKAGRSTWDETDLLACIADELPVPAIWAGSAEGKLLTKDLD